MTTLEIFMSVTLVAMAGVYGLIMISLVGEMRKKPGKFQAELDMLKAQNAQTHEGLALVQQTLLAAMGKAPK